MDVQNDDNFENVGLGCALDMFSEVDEVIEMIHNLENIYTQSSGVEKASERFLYILNQYNEQPHLLDPHLEKILTIFINAIRDKNKPMKLKHEIFKYMYVFVKVRSYKVVVRHLPHEVSDFEPVLQLLESQFPDSTETWETRYVLLIWMSIIIMIPFHMSRLDSFDSNNDETKKSVINRVLDVCKTYIVVNDKSRDAAAYLISKFLTRSDVKEVFLPEYLDWACNISNNETHTIFARYGALSSIANILKHGKRDDLMPYATKLLKWIIGTNYQESNDRYILKYGFKIIQRIGLVFLKPRIATWRYKRGNRSLAENLSAGDGCESNLLPKAEPETKDTPVDLDSTIEVPDDIEDVVDELMNGLRNSDSVIRWSAAKGLGRVTGRLPQELADEVVGYILELFNPREGDGAWHGGCLALAELGRRGLLLPTRLPEVVPVVLQALVYDEAKGYASVGAHIRDAACYVCWAFARAYDTQVLAPFVPRISSALLVVSVFDREINCRRAASAAFQENVGRQGTFPHGIDILTTADFFAVGVRTNAYLHISVYIAQFEEYTQSLIDHLLEKKVDHWDTAIRELTAKSLHNLTERAPTYMSNYVLEKLFEKTHSIDLNARHGAVLAIGEILHALSKVNESIENIISLELLKKAEHLVPRFRERQYFRGLGGELMRQACTNFIEKCSSAHMPFHNNIIIDDWLNLIDECLQHEVPSIRSGAIIALPALFMEYFRTDIVLDTQPTVKTIFDRYREKLKADTEVIRMGYALALGSLPYFMLKDHLELVIPAIIHCTKIQETTAKWAQSRRDALKAITAICRTVGVALFSPYIDDIYECLLHGLMEYTLDSRGDIGAWVREASMNGLQIITLLSAKHESQDLTPQLVLRIMQGIAQQAVEKIDRTRALAGKVFSNIIHSNPPVPYIPDHDILLDIFSSDICDSINWNSEADTFPRFVRLLALPNYTYSIMLGLIVSVGGLTEGLVKHSSASLFTFLKSIDEDKKHSELIRFCDVIINIFAKHQHVDRVTCPMFPFLDRLFNSGCIRAIVDDPQSQFAGQIFNLLKTEITDCKDTYKLIDSVNVLCQLIQVPNEVSSKSLVRLSMLLCHPQRYVRKSTSNRLYEALLLYGDSSAIPPESVDEAMTLISDTDWEQSVENLRPIRNQLCDLMGVKPPVVKPRKI